jgi:hypothetical protein
MTTFRVALLIACLAASTMQAQTTESQTTVPPAGEGMNLPRRYDLPQEAEAPERKLTVFPTAASRIASQADTLGDHGNLFLDNATAPSTGIQLLAKTAFPDIFLKLGLSTSGASFNVTDASDVSIFKVRGDGRAIFRKDQNGATTFEINNGTAGTAAYGTLQFFEGTTPKGGLYAFSSGTPGAPGGINSLMLSNALSAPLILGTSGTERMRVNADGSVAMNYAGVFPARLTVQHGNDNSSGIFVTHQPLVEASITQNDAGISIQTQENVQAGATNSGSVIGLNSWSQLMGTGVLANLTGAQILTGTTVAGTITNMFGVRVQSTAVANSTIGSAFAVYLDDVQGTNDYGFFQASSNDTNYFAGNVLIGGSPSAATSPYALTVQGDTRFIGAVAGTGTNVVGGTIQLTGFPTKLTFGNGQFIQDNSFANLRIFAGNNLTVDTNAGGDITMAPGSLNFRVTGNVLASESVTVGPAGGNQATQRFTVHGSAHFNGTVTGTNIKAHYQDVAEWVPSTTDLAPGTVVILNRGRSNEVMASASAYDTTVAGVVSAQPGLSLGIEGEGKEQVATTGRVKVRVDARLKPIAVGDLLVTSDTPGTAMRSEPMSINGRPFHQPGTILGKALEPLEGGVGEILVLLSMQ